MTFRDDTDMQPDKVPATDRLVDFARGTQISNLPEPVVEKVKRLLLDSVGCMVSGLRSEDVPSISSLADSLGSGSSSTKIGHGKSSVAAATLHNSYALSASTAMDSYTPAAFHLTPSVVPTALAVGEEVECDGSDLLVAVSIGLEVGVRIAAGLNFRSFRERGWHAPGVVGPFASAVAAGRLYGLEETQMRNALGLAGSQAAGTVACWGTPTVKFHQARGALAGMMAAALARQGFDSAHDFLSTEPGGLYYTYSDGGAVADVSLGKDWALMELSMRQFPSAHPSVSTALVTALAGSPYPEATVATVTVRVPPAMKAFDVFKEPRSEFEALNSIHHLVAVMCETTDLGPESFTQSYYQDANVRRLREQVKVEADPHLSGQAVGVSIQYGNGELAEFSSDVPKGSPTNPLSKEEVVAKFHRLTRYRLPEMQRDRIVEFVWTLEDRTDISALLGFCA
jgi:2-methylcitrate dehydratase PrpD